MRTYKYAYAFKPDGTKKEGFTRTGIENNVIVSVDYYTPLTADEKLLIINAIESLK